MRSNSSRQFVGWVGEALYSAAPGTPALATGISGSRSAPAGSIGTWLLGKNCPVAGLMGQSANDPVVWFGQRSLKLPCRSALEGTSELNTWPGTLSFRHSCDQKKKVFVLLVL